MRRSLAAVALSAFLLVTATGVDPLQSLFRKSRAGERALDAGNADEAIRLYTEAQALAPDDPRLVFNLGNALAAAGRLDEAVRAFDRAAELNDGRIARDSRFNRGVLELGRDDAASAVEGFAGALLVDPQDDEARRNLELAMRRLPPPQPSGSPSESGEHDPDSEPEESDESAQGGETSDDSSGEESPQSESGRAPEEPSERSDEGDESTEERSESSDTQPDEQRTGDDVSREPSPSPAGESAARGGGERDADAEMAERVLKSLEKGEREALQRALRRRLEGNPERERDW